MDKILDAKITAFLDQSRAAILADVDRLLRFDSTTGEPEEGAPFGRNVKDAIDAILDICAAHGLKTRNIDGMIGEAVYGSGEKSLGILAHVDIVPTGAGWSKPPLELTIEDGMLYGRGITDDKGPAVASIWALMAALDAGAEPNGKIVFLFGGDEEQGMRCVRRYLETEPAPDIAFSPDGGFPAIFCEKTLCHGTLSAPIPEGSALVGIRGGTRTNVVPNKASAVLSAKPSGLLPEGAGLEESEEGWVVTAHGTAAHASTPEKGDNAIVRLLDALTRLLPEGDPAIPEVARLHGLCSGSDGSGFGIACADETSGPLTFNLGVISGIGGNIVAQFDIRHPVFIDPEENLYERLPEAAEAAGYAASGISVSRGFCIPKEHGLVKTLMGIYNEINESADEPLAIGGGTYARLLPCAVAYGMLFEGDPETAHMADERISVESFMKATRIYANAIAELLR